LRSGTLCLQDPAFKPCRSIRHQLSGDYESLNVAGAFVDLADPYIAIDPLHGHVFGVANTTMDLNRVGAHSFGHFGGV
jgi:hypothetical protein